MISENRFATRGFQSLFLATTCCALLSGCSSHHGDPAGSGAKEKAAAPPYNAVAIKVGPEDWQVSARVQGTLYPNETTTAATKVAGRVEEVFVDLGDWVEENELLLRLDREEFELQVQQAEAALSQACAAIGLKSDADLSKVDRTRSPLVLQEQAVLAEAQATLKRYEQLSARNTITAAEVEQAAAAVKVADARYSSALNAVDEKLALIRVRRVELNQMMEQLARTELRAPMAGFVESRLVSPGTYVQAGQSVLTVVSLDPLRYRAAVPERFSRQLAVGQKVLVRVDELAPPRTAVVTRISPSLDIASRSLSFEADVPNADSSLRNGLFATGDVILNAAEAVLAVPRTAVIEFAGVEKVWKVVDGRAMEQIIETGRRDDDRIEIVNGLSAGDVVLLDSSAGKRGPVTVEWSTKPQREDNTRQTAAKPTVPLSE